ncbi:MmgE/PrpD family protein [Pseudonocardia thermophila]|uniref:MmgE/PrpD family protein n=1 Tax=Pseudonocardia thermophila TaxID=1848 RepID=UPI00248DC193|nr:MmgE/PrpD family protein [Pseudonocardia thermophila]
MITRDEEITDTSAQQAAREHTEQLGAWVAGLRWSDVPTRVQDRLGLVLLDTLGVCLVGARQPEHRRLVEVWRPVPGPAPIVGTSVCTAPETAAWVNALALVRLELDEGNKYARGHPAAHGFPVVLALAAELRAPGPVTMAALAAAYEVSSRFGRATQLRAGTHPHGNWGVPGAAAGCARLLGLTAQQTAAAIDTGAGNPVAGHFASALDGNPVRDTWIGASNVSGLAAARLAAAGLARNTGTAAFSLGALLGEFHAAEVSTALGERWDVELGYFKRHASCSFTHPAADAVLALRPRLLTDGLDEIEEIVVETHSLGAGLARTSWDARLGALFSIPFVVAAALVHGHVRPSVSEGAALDDPQVRALAARVVVRAAPDLDARLPAERAARITVRRPAGNLVAEVPNPVGDSAHHPFGLAELTALLTDLLGDAGPVEVLTETVTALPTASDASALLTRLAHL